MGYGSRASGRRLKTMVASVLVGGALVTAGPSAWDTLRDHGSSSADQNNDPSVNPGEQAVIPPDQSKDEAFRCKRIQISRVTGSAILYAEVAGDAPLGTYLEYSVDYRGADDVDGSSRPDILSAQLPDGDIRAAEGHLVIPGHGLTNCNPYHAPRN